MWHMCYNYYMSYIKDMVISSRPGPYLIMQNPAVMMRITPSRGRNLASRPVGMGGGGGNPRIFGGKVRVIFFRSCRWNLKYFDDFYMFYSGFVRKWSNLTNTFQLGWNQRLVIVWPRLDDTFIWLVKMNEPRFLNINSVQTMFVLGVRL